jgi:hypothetical protein
MNAEPNDYRVYTCAEGAARIGSAVIKASTLYRLARHGLVKHTRNGRKVGWTDAQLAGVVDYLASKNSRSKARPRQERPAPPKPHEGSALTASPSPRYAAFLATTS